MQTILIEAGETTICDDSIKDILTRYNSVLKDDSDI